jgi:hypothetical protein
MSTGYSTHYFGQCECGRPGDLVHVIAPDVDGVFHFMACSECRTRWYIGSGFLTGWQHDGEHDDEDAWLERSREFMETRREIRGDVAQN